jgi:hypothetical protein
MSFVPAKDGRQRPGIGLAAASNNGAAAKVRPTVESEA